MSHNLSISSRTGKFMCRLKYSGIPGLGTDRYVCEKWYLNKSHIGI